MPGVRSQTRGLLGLSWPGELGPVHRVPCLRGRAWVQVGPCGERAADLLLLRDGAPPWVRALRASGWKRSSWRLMF